MAKKYETLSIRINPDLKRRVRIKLLTHRQPVSMTALVEMLFAQWLDTPVYWAGELRGEAAKKWLEQEEKKNAK